MNNIKLTTNRPVSFTVDFDAIKDASNIIFLNDEAKKIKPAEMKKDLIMGYRAGMIIIPVVSGIQIQVAMMTPYKTDMEIDINFLKEQYKEFCIASKHSDWIPKNDHDFFLGEVTYGEDS